jgi:hypothetical protein
MIFDEDHYRVVREKRGTIDNPLTHFKMIRWIDFESSLLHEMRHARMTQGATEVL